MLSDRPVGRRKDLKFSRLPLILLLAGSLSSCCKAAVSQVRGLQPTLASKYSLERGKFTCLDGSLELAADRVNDDFCDCVDGSDEPGTSACPTGQFYCRNRGHVPLLLNSSSVNDGFCDCCDGSDEPSGVCRNTCADAGAANRAALKARAEAFRQGLRAKDRYKREAAASRLRWEAEVVHLGEAEAELQKIVTKLQGKKERIERLEAKEREREQALQKQKDDEDAARKAAEEASKPAGSDEGPTDSTPEAGPGSTDPNEPAHEQPAAGAEEEELSEEEKGRRIAAQWTRDPEAVGAAETRDEVPPADDGSVRITYPRVPKYGPPDMSEAMTDAADEQAEEEDKETAVLRRGFADLAKHWLYSKLGWEYTASAPAASHRQQIKDDHQAQSTKLHELVGRRTDLEGKLKMDAGPDSEFLALVDKCFSASVEKYVYEVCPFKSAVQKDGGMTTSLGSWQGYGGDHAGLVFANGQSCWNGPMRSMKVSLQCGPKEELSGVEEPSRCEYTARLTTPAACSAAEVEAVQAQLQAAERELTEKEEL